MSHRTFNVGVLGATGAVGQRMVSLLDGHPWFKLVAVAASERSVGKTYADACNWTLDVPMPSSAAGLRVQPCVPDLGCDIVFSALDANVAGEVETAFAAAGCAVVSNAKNHRMDDLVPLVIPEVNADHLRLIHSQRAANGWSKGCLVTNPNCSTVGLVCALKPLHVAFGVTKVLVTTMQAISGAGYPGVASLDITDNVVPHIGGEEGKIETETLKLLGDCPVQESAEPVGNARIVVSAHCNRVPVIDGHLESVSVELERRANRGDIIHAWRNFRSAPHYLQLPTVPQQFIAYHEANDRPQPRRDRSLGNGMTVSVGRLRECPLFDWKFTVLSHNTVRGAAGAAIANAELLVAQGYVV